MYGLGVNRLGVTNVSSSGFNPLSLFANGEQGVWYDPSDLTTVFQPDGTTPTVPWVSGVVTDANRVGKIVDKSRASPQYDLIQTTATKCPTLVSDNGLYYLDFDGTDDGMRTTANIPFGTNSVQEMSVFAAAQKDTAGVVQNIAELSNNLGSQDGVFRLFYTAGNIWRSVQKGDVANTLQSTVITDNPDKIVMTSVASISAPSHLLRIDGSLINSNTNSLGNGPYTDQPLSIGSRAGGTASKLDGRIYGIIVRGKVSTANEISSVEKYLADKSGVTL
jgi:hypothetical protein